MNFKATHPTDLISRLFLLEYLRELGPDMLYSRANKNEKELFFYKYENIEGGTFVDINWERLVFDTELSHLETFAKKYLEEIEEIEKARQPLMAAKYEQQKAEEAAMPMDINIMDLAQSEIRKNNDPSQITGSNGLIQ